MTWRNWAWNGKFIWLLIALALVFVAIGVAVLVDDSASDIERNIAIPILGVILLLMISMHNWLTVSPGEVKIGFFPFYRRTIPIGEIADLSIVEIRPLREYGGWGVRGLASMQNGLLLGGHPPRGLRIETTGDKRYIVTFQHLEPIVEALAQQGCTLSAGNEHSVAGKV